MSTRLAEVCTSCRAGQLMMMDQHKGSIKLSKCVVPGWLLLIHCDSCCLARSSRSVCDLPWPGA